MSENTKKTPRNVKFTIFHSIILKILKTVLLCNWQTQGGYTEPTQIQLCFPQFLSSIKEGIIFYHLMQCAHGPECMQNDTVTCFSLSCSKQPYISPSSISISLSQTPLCWLKTQWSNFLYITSQAQATGTFSGLLYKQRKATYPTVKEN